MEKVVVTGGNSLNGEVVIDGAKNAVLPILASSLLMEEGEQMVLTNVPNLSDVQMMIGVLRSLNMIVKYSETLGKVVIIARKPLGTEASYDYVSKMRASSIVLGPIVAKEGSAKIAMPGGCSIGSRPLDLHFKGLEALGANIKIKNGYICAESIEEKPQYLKGANIYLDFPSVGATENIVMASVLAKGRTIISNVAREPEIVDLIAILNKMGAKIEGSGTSELVIEGVKSLHGVEHEIVQDRIEAGTFMVAVAVASGDVLIKDAVYAHNKPLINKLREMGVIIEEVKGGLRVISDGKLEGTKVKTLPYPGFPTDLQSPMTLAQIVADGLSVMEETVFENRFMHLEELRRMGAESRVSGDVAIMEGKQELTGAVVSATDLRASATLILAGLVAKGETTVTHLEHLDRGYSHFVEKLQSLGANVVRIAE